MSDNPITPAKMVIVNFLNLPGGDTMSKVQILEVIATLPAEVDLDDLLSKLYVLEKIERGEQQIDAGQCVSHEEAKKRLGV